EIVSNPDFTVHTRNVVQELGHGKTRTHIIEVAKTPLGLALINYWHFLTELNSDGLIKSKKGMQIVLSSQPMESSDPLCPPASAIIAVSESRLTEEEVEENTETQFQFDADGRVRLNIDGFPESELQELIAQQGGDAYLNQQVFSMIGLENRHRQALD